MSERTYVVTLNVPEKLLSGVLKKVGTEMLESVSQKGQAQATKTSVLPSVFVGGYKNKGVSAVDLIMGMLMSANRAFSRKEIIKAMMAKNFSQNSINAPIYRLIKGGKVRAIGNGYYAATQQSSNGGEQHV